VLTAVLLKNVLVANKAAPVVSFLDLLHVGVCEVPADAFVAEDERTGGTAEDFASLAAPPAVVLRTIFALSKFTGVLWKKSLNSKKLLDFPANSRRKRNTCCTASRQEPDEF
jgi:hypothetical protein